MWKVTQAKPSSVLKRFSQKAVVRQKLFLAFGGKKRPLLPPTACLPAFPRAIKLSAAPPETEKEVGRSKYKEAQIAHLTPC